MGEILRKESIVPMSAGISVSLFFSCESSEVAQLHSGASALARHSMSFSSMRSSVIEPRWRQMDTESASIAAGSLPIPLRATSSVLRCAAQGHDTCSNTIGAKEIVLDDKLPKPRFSAAIAPMA